MDGNTLTLIETKVVLEGITVGGKSMREHLEVINHKEAILFLEDLVKENNELSEFDIKTIHRLNTNGSNEKNRIITTLQKCLNYSISKTVDLAEIK